MSDTDRARRLIARAEAVLAVLAVVVAVAVGLIVAQGPPRAPTAITTGTVFDTAAGTGLLAGAVTLAVCWVLLALLGGRWRAGLADRDTLDWTSGWARVEPGWSGRRV